MRYSESQLTSALKAWQQLLGNDRILQKDSTWECYSKCTSTRGRHMPAALKPESADQISALIRIAVEHTIPLYPISTGHNWGYGSSNPVEDDCVILDLSDLCGISDFDPELGLITVEPGVTQQQLYEFLDAQSIRYLVPVTGAGPTCSILGNALERGYGITPYSDHFSAVTSIEAVLADGSIYRSALSDMGIPGVDQAFKWGLGPYLDGLFSQGNLGVVTRMTIALAPAPEQITAFFFRLRSRDNLRDTVETIRGILRDEGANIGAINLMNAHRILAMTNEYPVDDVPPGGTLSEDQINKLVVEQDIGTWNGLGAIYASKPLTRALKRIISRRLKPHVNRLVFITEKRLSLLQSATTLIPGAGSSRLGKMITTLRSSLNILSGKPSEVALPLAYWKRRNTMPEGHLDPARDQCGLIWYAPLVPMKPENVERYVGMITSICPKYGIEPLITLTSLSHRCFDSTIPLLFDQEEPGALARAKACYRELLKTGKENGFFPYRVGIDSMKDITNMGDSFWNTVSGIKTAMDPHNIISPGRYAPAPRNDDN